MRTAAAGLAIVMLFGCLVGSATAGGGIVGRSGLIRRANTFCLTVKFELHSLYRPGRPLAAHGPRARQAVEDVDHKLNRLKAARPAASAAARWKAFVGAAVAVDRQLLVFVKGSTGGLASLLMLAQAARAAAAAGVDLGARDCAA